MSNVKTRVRDPERRERILTAAADLIAQRGYLGVNMADIGTAAGIVGSGIYRHFDNKSAILVEMFNRVVDRLIDDAEKSLSEFDHPATTLAALIHGQVRFTIEERQLCQVYLQEACNLPAGDLRRLRWKQRHYIDLWQDVLGAVHPQMRPAELQVAVHAAISAIQSMLRFHSPLPTEELAVLLDAVARRALAIGPEEVAAQPLDATPTDPNAGGTS